MFPMDSIPSIFGVYQHNLLAKKKAPLTNNSCLQLAQEPKPQPVRVHVCVFCPFEIDTIFPAAGSSVGN